MGRSKKRAAVFRVGVGAGRRYHPHSKIHVVNFRPPHKGEVRNRACFEARYYFKGAHARSKFTNEKRTTARERVWCNADGDRQRTVIQADAQKQQRVISAEGIKVETITVAEGNLESATLSAKGVEAQGLAKGAAEQAVLMAPVNAQITLAKEIGGNEGYQTYLIRVKDIEASQAVGIAQADALKVANIKVIANAGTPGDGIKSVGDLFTSRGGLAVGAALEGLGNANHWPLTLVKD